MVDEEDDEAVPNPVIASAGDAEIEAWCKVLRSCAEYYCCHVLSVTALMC